MPCSCSCSSIARCSGESERAALSPSPPPCPRTVDANIHTSPSSVTFLTKQQESAKETGVPYVELDDETRQKAEQRYYKYYQYFDEAEATAQGPASFH